MLFLTCMFPALFAGCISAAGQVNGPCCAFPALYAPGSCLRWSSLNETVAWVIISSVRAFQGYLRTSYSAQSFGRNNMLFGRPSDLCTVSPNHTPAPGREPRTFASWHLDVVNFATGTPTSLRSSGCVHVTAPEPKNCATPCCSPPDCAVQSGQADLPCRNTK